MTRAWLVYETCLFTLRAAWFVCSPGNNYHALYNFLHLLFYVHHFHWVVLFVKLRCNGDFVVSASMCNDDWDVGMKYIPVLASQFGIHE